MKPKKSHIFCRPFELSAILDFWVDSFKMFLLQNYNEIDTLQFLGIVTKFLLDQAAFFQGLVSLVGQLMKTLDCSPY